MLKTLGDETYTIEWRIVNAIVLVPQRRIRVFIIATKKKKGAKKQAEASSVKLESLRALLLKS